jgi:uncharacterized protein
MRHFPPCPLYTHTSLPFPRVLIALTTVLVVTLALAQAPAAWAKKAQTDAKSNGASLADRPASTGPTRETAGQPQNKPEAPNGVPQKILIVGDSFAVGLGMTMEQSFKPVGPVALASRGKVSSGLNSPRFYDWEKSLTDFLVAEKPTVLVVMLGGNDAKNGQGTPQWSTDFQAKAKRFLDIAGNHHVKVYWVGLPPMREKAFSQRAWIANEAMRAACASASACRFIDSWDLFADTSGKFCAKKPLAGKAISLRGKDGVHFSAAGCKLLTDRIATGMTTAQ